MQCWRCKRICFPLSAKLLSEKNLKGFTLLHVAAMNNKVKILRLLLKYGAPVDLKCSSQNRAALSYAFEHRFREIAIALIESGSNLGNSTVGDALLHGILNEKDQQLSLLLFENDVDIDAIGSTIMSGSLQISTTFSHVLCHFGSLFDAGADYMSANNYFTTLLHRACRYKDRDVSIFLRTFGDRGINLEDDGDEYDEPFLWSACKTKNVAFAKELLACGNADINMVDSSSMSLLHYACINGNEDVVELLLSHGINMDHVDDNNRVALDYARGRPKIFTMIMEKKSQIQMIRSALLSERYTK